MAAMNEFKTVVVVITTLTLAACASQNTAPYPPKLNLAQSGNAYVSYGVVQSIELIQSDGATGNNIGLGTLAGAVVGGVLGNQVGGGRGNTAATVIGAAGGAYVGHQIENQPSQKADAYKITVRMEDGAYQAVTQDKHADLRVGDRVRLDNGVLQRY